MKQSKKLWLVGICLVLLALLAGCVSAPPAETTAAPTEAVSTAYEIYWNLDRALYDGMSEAGMSSRTMESDGYFYIRFFKDGQIVTLRTTDRKVVNSIDVNDFMGLVLDDNGIITNVLDVERGELPCQLLASRFYVQSAGGDLIKLNSSASFVGMELLLETDENTGVWDMTGKSGEVGGVTEPVKLDRVVVIGDAEGKPSHVFIYDRPGYMRTHEGECKHCGKTVTWSEWTQESYLPTQDGHYQLMNDIQLTGQSNIAEDAKLCLDLNGKTVTGKKNTRMYSLHNPGAELAMMDSVGGGKLVAHGENSGSQGICVWARYGVFHLYEGILDARAVVSTNSGITVNIPKGSFMYMHGGEIIGATAKYSYNKETKKYSAGLGGAMSVAGKLVMNDGIIRDGYAQAKVTVRNADGTPKTTQRGLGGNVFIAGTGVVEMNGGTIQNGRSDGAGGNIYIDGAGEFTMNGGTISGGRTRGNSKSGGNIIGYSKVRIVINGGTVKNGSATYRGGNIYTTGNLRISAGAVRGGRLVKYGTGEELADQSSRNIYFADNYCYIYGGMIEGGFRVADTNATKEKTSVTLAYYPYIVGKTGPNLTVIKGGSGVQLSVHNLREEAKVGISASGIFTLPTEDRFTQHFFSDVEGAEVVYVDGCLGLGRFSCLCGSNSENVSDHLGDCKAAGIQNLFWGPVTSTTSLPSTTGNYYLVQDVSCTSQTSLAADADVKLDLNGYTVTGPENFRTISVHNTGAKLTICDSSEGKTGVIRSHGVGSSQGNVVWTRYGDFDFYGGTLDGSAYTYTDGWNEGKDGIFGTTDDTISSRDGGALCMGSGSTTMRMFAGTVIGNNAAAVTQTKTVDGKEVSFKTTSPGGASLYVPAGCTFEMYGGTIRDGISEDYGGNVLLAGTMIIDGGQILDGICTYNGGNINTKSGSHLELHSGSIEGGWGKNVTGNLHCSGTFTMTGGEITGGKVGKTPSATSAHADIQFVNGDMDYTGGKLGNIQLTNSNTSGTEGGCVVTLSGELDIAAIKLSTYDSKPEDEKNPTMPILVIGGTVQSANAIPVTPSDTTADFAIGKDYALCSADAAPFTLSGSTVTAAADTTTNSLFFGRIDCLCGKETHTKGCMDLWNGTEKRWTPWTSTTTLPTTTAGNYYLTNNVTLPGVQTLQKNVVVTLDLNGFTVTGPNNTRMYATQNTGSSLTITDKSAAQTGKLVARGTNFVGIKSTCIWVRYGEFNLLGGTLDASQTVYQGNWDGSVVERNGGVIYLEANRAANIYGGTIIGTNAKATTINGNAVPAPSGGSIYVPSGATLNMYGGTIEGGSTERYGGNLYLAGTANLYGGTIKGGSAVDGGNIYALSGSTLNVHEGFVIEDGNATKYGGNLRLYGTLNLQGGAIQNGTCTLNGGNIYSNSGSVINMTSGSITGGWGKSQTGNIHCCGTLNMSGGSITGGKTDSSGITTAVGRDIAFVNGTLNYTGGRLDSLRGTNYNSDGREGGCVLNLGGTLDIGAISLGSYDDKDDDGNTPTAPLLNITGAVSGCVSYIATAEGIFAQGSGYTLTDSDANAFTTELNLSGLPGGILREDNTLAVRAYSCLCGKSEHTKGCMDLWGGEKRVWTAWTSTTTLPTTTGNYYLTANVSLSSKGVQKLAANANVVLNLNGFTVTGKTNDRMYATHNTGSNLTITDNSASQTGKMVGVGDDFAGKSCCIWIRYGTLNILGGTFDGSGTTIHNAWESNKLAEKNGGVICLEKNRTFNMYGGTIIGAKAVKTTVDGNELYAPMGASIYLPSGAVMNMHGGTVKGGNTEKNGGNLYIYGGTLNMHGGTIQTGEADDCGGNLFVRGGTVNMDGGVIKNGTRNGVAANLTANFAFTNGGTLNISGGEIHGRLNLGTTIASSDTKTGTVNISGSAKIYSPTAANPVANNNLSATLTVNIGKLNDDAMIGLQVSSTGKPLTSEKLLASYSDEESLQKALTDGRIGISVYMSGDTYNRTYAFVTRDGKLYVYQTSATPK